MPSARAAVRQALVLAFGVPEDRWPFDPHGTPEPARATA
uniref:Uncharacterized protein n=1 Tax=uncultured Armatimonadetes bacterium TaxID=157466 RepID=A0A6J4K9B3_9BACT|nr:hypothetical protein AVDCRST_MAG63-4986 [uncultured Armatimonadetes bacterium]